MAARLAALVLIILALAGCLGPETPQGLYAPGPVPGAEAADPLLDGQLEQIVYDRKLVLANPVPHQP